MNKYSTANQQLYGILLSEYETDFINKNLRQLKDRAPTYACVELNFDQDNRLYRGSLTMTAGDKTFTAEALAHSLVETYKKLERHIDVDLLLWKRTRFLISSECN